MITTTTFANQDSEKLKTNEPVTKCCTKSANNGQTGANYISVTVTRCTTSNSGNYHAATAHACSAAQANATAAANNIQEMTLTLTNKN